MATSLFQFTDDDGDQAYLTTPPSFAPEGVTAVLGVRNDIGEEHEAYLTADGVRALAHALLDLIDEKPEPPTEPTIVDIINALNPGDEVDFSDGRVSIRRAELKVIDFAGETSILPCAA